MAFLFDFFPVILFFAAFKLYDIYVATGVIIVASLAQVSITWLRNKKVQKMHIITAVLVLVFGGVTLLLEDEIYIKWKPTVVNWLFAIAFIISAFIGEKPIIQRMLGGEIQLPRHVWQWLNWMWVTFFAVLGVINLVVVYNFDTSMWVNFKLFGILGLTLIFVLLQGLYIARYLPQEGQE
ncbi:MAG: septation protein A [Gammaproteobacteria bacterium]|nr:septation protein A [Gammaproteobacteria bacterium]